MPADELVLEDGPAGRRQLRLRIGSIAVQVIEVPGSGLNDREWEDVLLARRSYTAMWGADPVMMANDPQDGREGGVYDARHYLAWVRDGVEAGVAAGEEAQPGKLVTMRKVRLAAARLTATERANPFDLLPIDIQFWRVRTPTGHLSLWEALAALARRLAPGDEHAEFRIATIGRTGTFPYGQPRSNQRQRELTAIGFAAIQLLAAHGDPNLLWANTLRTEFRDRVLAITDLRGESVAPDFVPTALVLGVAADAVCMNDELVVVQEHKANYPGYFVRGDDAAAVLVELLDQGRLTYSDLGATFAQLVIDGAIGPGLGHIQELARVLEARDNQGVARLLTQPRLFKYLRPLIVGEEPLSRMSSVEFRTRLVRGSRDGPFSSTVTPAAWAASARAVLGAAATKYGAGALPTQLTRDRRMPRVRSA